VMALERVPADIRRDGGVARMSDPKVTPITVSFVSILGCSPYRKSKKSWLLLQSP